VAKKDREKRKKREVDVSRRMKEHSTGFSSTSLKLPEDVGFFKPKKEGTYRLEIIPYEVGKGNPYADEGAYHYERTYYAHRGIGANSDSYVCLAKTYGEKCPVCEHQALLRKKNGDEDEIRSLAPQQRQLFLLYDHAEGDKGLQLWDVTHGNFGKRLDYEIRNADEDEADTVRKFANQEDGCTLKVSMEEKSFSGNKYLACESIKFVPRKEELDDDLYDKAPCLDDLLIKVDYAKLKAIFLQTGDEEEEEEEDDEKPKSKKGGKAKSKKDEDDEDDDEDETPKSKKGKAKSSKDEDDEEEEDDEDETPSRKTVLKMPRAELKKLIKAKGLDVDPDDHDTAKELAEAVADALEGKGKKKGGKSSSKDEDEEEEEEEEKPKAKGKKKPKASDDEDDEDEKPKSKKKGKKDDDEEEEEEDDDWD
jgi:hypothetical protein